MARSSPDFRGPFARWPRAADAVLAVALFLASAMLIEGPGDTLAIQSITNVPIWALGVLAVAAGGIYLRRHTPVVTFGVTVVGWALLIPTDVHMTGLMTLFALYTVGRYTASTWQGVACVAAAVAALIVEGLARDIPWTATGFGVVVMIVIRYTGQFLRLRDERTDQRRRQRESEARRIVAEERTHIARELHDVVAHQVSMMTVQAGAAQAVVADDPEGARQAMAAVEQAGRQALNELRHLLGVLRPDAAPNGLGPQPGLADLPRLVDQFGSTGLNIEIVDTVTLPLPGRVQLSAYRIVQEALTNVLKHGGAGTRTEVHLRDDDGELTIEVLDHAAPGPPVARAPGHGIIGMRERATLLGGTLDAGPCPEGGFRVLARLPLTGET